MLDPATRTRVADSRVSLESTVLASAWGWPEG
jgi:hypothetical protein